MIMGMGDEIMAAGRAERLYAASGWPVAIVDSRGRPRRHFIWEDNPAIDPKSSQHLLDSSGSRPYIQQWLGRRVLFNYAHRPVAGHVYLSKAERGWASEQMLPQDFAVIEPHVFTPSSPNKVWGFERWKRVAHDLFLPVYQLGPDDGRPPLPGAHRLITPTARHAAAVIEKASVVLTTEGGTHHLAAALRRPAVVIFGAFTPPEVTGYDIHTNLAVTTEEGFCGRYTPCDHCQAAMAQISPELVLRAARAILARGEASLQRTAPEKALS